MITYIKDYGISSLEYEYVVSNLKPEVKDLFKVNQLEVEKNLKFLSDYGVYEGMARLIVARPDLFVQPLESLKENVKKLNKSVFVNIANKSPEDLILLGV